MKSYVVYKDHTCGFEEMPMPKYGEYDALVKLESCGVCTGTDTKIIHGKFKSIDTYPVVLGHEGVGRVVPVQRRGPQVLERRSRGLHLRLGYLLRI